MKVLMHFVAEEYFNYWACESLKSAFSRMSSNFIFGTEFDVTKNVKFEIIPTVETMQFLHFKGSGNLSIIYIEN